uniref:HD domain-containing protein n=1 Tax=viral metagenome TaxID=1070528 RepID=A0A6C0HCJ8_9ZZZZ
MTAKHNMDETHGIMHSMNVLNYAHEIYESELPKNPFLIEQQKIIYVSAALHDMCDRKYIDEDIGIRYIQKFLEHRMDQNEIDITKKIITTMSYSKVKKNGFPELGEYQSAYHIVREADLLSAYDFDRCIIYKMKQSKENFENSFYDAKKLFEERMFQHNNDGLFITDYSKRESFILEQIALHRIHNWNKIIHNTIK